MKFLGNNSESMKNIYIYICFISEKKILSPFLLLLQKQPFLILEIKPFSVVPPPFTKLCFCSSSSAAVSMLMGSGSLRRCLPVPSSSSPLYLLSLPPQTCSWAQCAWTASGFLPISHWLCAIHLGPHSAQVFLINSTVFPYPLLLPREEEVLTG